MLFKSIIINFIKVIFVILLFLYNSLQKEKEDQEKRHTKECEDLRKDAFEKY